MKVTVNPEEIAGTIFAEIFQITAPEIENVRLELTGQSITDCDKVEGTLSEFEKKIFATLSKKHSEVENLIPDFDGTESSDLPDLGILRQTLRQAEVLKEDINFLRNMMFLMIQRRLGFQGSKISIREDFQLVSPKPVGMEDMGGHDCANCSHKDDCPLQSGEFSLLSLLNEFAGVGFLNDKD